MLHEALNIRPVYACECMFLSRSLCLPVNKCVFVYDGVTPPACLSGHEYFSKGNNKLEPSCKTFGKLMGPASVTEERSSCGTAECLDLSLAAQLATEKGDECDVKHKYNREKLTWNTDNDF